MFSTKEFPMNDHVVDTNKVHSSRISKWLLDFKDGLISMATIRNLLLCLPSFSLFTSVVFVIVISVPYYGSLGVNVNSLLIIVAISRALEAICDPFIAQWYESIRPEYNNDEIHRAQTTLIGSIFTGIMIGLHLSPPMSLQSENALFTWFSWTYIGFFISLSFVNIPITAFIWQAFPYLGSKEQYKRSILALCNECIHNVGLGLVFILSGFTSTLKASKKESLDIYNSCYSDTGIGRSCQILPDTGDYRYYTIFEPTLWNTTTNTCSYMDNLQYTNPYHIYTPLNCLSNYNTTSTSTSSSSMNIYNNNINNYTCIENYCNCINECTNLVNLDYRQHSLSIAGWLMGSSIVLTTLFILLYKYNYKNLFYPMKSTIKPKVIDRNIEEITIKTRNKRPIEAIIPKLMNLLRNKVIRSFLVPWFIDILLYLMIITTLYSYIHIIIQPEYLYNHNIFCNNNISIFTTSSSYWQCSSIAVYSISLTIIFLTSIIISYIWYLLYMYVGSVRVWQLNSIITLFTIITLIFTYNKHNTVVKFIGLSLLLCISFSSKYFTEIIIIDIIYYYEFITGYRYTHIFAMFKLLFYKISIIFIQLLPICILYHTNSNTIYPVYEQPTEYTKDHSIYIILFTIIIPSILCIISFMMKLSIRIVEKEQFNLIHDGIQILYYPNNNTTTTTSNTNEKNNKIKERMPASPSSSPMNSPNTLNKNRKMLKHENSNTTITITDHNTTTVTSTTMKSPTIILRKRTTSYDSIASSNKEETTTVKLVPRAIDPTSGLTYPSEVLKYRELEYAQIFAYFPDTQYIIDYHSCAKSQSPQIGVELLINRTRDIAAVSFILTVALSVGLVFTSEFLVSHTALLFVPLLMIILLGWAVFICYCAVQSLRSAISLKDPTKQPTVRALEKIIRNLDRAQEIAKVRLPTREVMRRYKDGLEQPQSLKEEEEEEVRTTSSNLDMHPTTTATSSSMDPRTSQEARELLQKEAYRASIPTKETEVMEWEQALFRATKRALVRAKQPSQRTRQLIKVIKRSCTLHTEGGVPELTRWEAEFYSYIAAQHTSKAINNKDEKGTEANSSASELSSATAESSCEGEGTQDDQMGAFTSDMQSMHNNHSTSSNNKKKNQLPQQPLLCRKQASSSTSSSGGNASPWDSDIDLSFDSQDPDLQGEGFTAGSGGGVHGHVHYHTTASSWDGTEGSGKGLDSEGNHSTRRSSSSMKRRKFSLADNYDSEGEHSSVVYSLEESSTEGREAEAERAVVQSHSHSYKGAMRPRPESIDLGVDVDSADHCASSGAYIQLSTLQQPTIPSHSHEDEDMKRHRFKSIELSPAPSVTDGNEKEVEVSNSEESEQDEDMDSVDYSLPSSLS